MTVKTMAERLADIQRGKGSNLALWIAPQLSQMPAFAQPYDDPFLPFGKAIINTTCQQVCAYVFDLAAYLAIGAAGAVALERTIAYAQNVALTILHGPFTGTKFATVMDEGAFNPDGVTIIDEKDWMAYNQRPDRSAFVIRQGQVKSEYSFPAYWQDSSVFTLPGRSHESLLIRSLGEEVYLSRRDDFAESLYAEIEKRRV